MAKLRTYGTVSASTTTENRIAETSQSEIMNTQTAFIVPEFASDNNHLNQPMIKTVLVQINVAEDHLEDNIKKSFALVKSMGRELDITFRSNETLTC